MPMLGCMFRSFGKSIQAPRSVLSNEAIMWGKEKRKPGDVVGQMEQFLYALNLLDCSTSPLRLNRQAGQVSAARVQCLSWSRPPRNPAWHIPNRRSGPGVPCAGHS